MPSQPPWCRRSAPSRQADRVRHGRSRRVPLMAVSALLDTEHDYRIDEGPGPRAGWLCGTCSATVPGRNDLDGAWFPHWSDGGWHDPRHPSTHLAASTIATFFVVTEELSRRDGTPDESDIADLQDASAALLANAFRPPANAFPTHRSSRWRPAPCRRGSGGLPTALDSRTGYDRPSDLRSSGKGARFSPS